MTQNVLSDSLRHSSDTDLRSSGASFVVPFLLWEHLWTDRRDVSHTHTAAQHIFHSPFTTQYLVKLHALPRALKTQHREREREREREKERKRERGEVSGLQGFLLLSLFFLSRSLPPSSLSHTFHFVQWHTLIIQFHSQAAFTRRSSPLNSFSKAVNFTHSN